MKLNPSPLINNKIVAFLGIILAVITNNAQVIGQNITPANDPTGTIVNINGNTFNITGGSMSEDGTNLFHSLQQFGLTSEQIANFLTNPNINNIFTRIVGGSPSFIDGLIQVTGGNSNLFLMNPSGIVFGSNASLNLLGDFTATTATGIGFNNNNWFNVVGDNNYANLIGNPSFFAFDLTENGTIINLGNLEVAKGQNLTLLGGTVINTGTLRASNGNINIVAVPGTSKIEISNPGDVISIVIEPPRDNNGNILPFKATDIPTLITKGVTGLNINNNGEITTNLGTVIPQEQGININTGTIDVSSVENTGGNITIVGNKIGVVDNSQILAFGNNGGGLIRIGGDYQGQGNIFNAQDTFIGENVNINSSALTNGDGGRVIVWADDTTIFNGNIFARGGNISGDGGFAEVSGKENLLFRGDVDLSAINGNFGTLLLDPTNIVIVNGSGGTNDGQLPTILGNTPGTTFTISETALEGISGNTNILLQATNDITINDLADNALTFQRGSGNITFTADADNDGNGNFSMNLNDWIEAPSPIALSPIELDGRTLAINANTIQVGNINTRSGVDSNGLPGGSVELRASGNITTVTFQVYADSCQPSPCTPINPANSGNITIISNNGTINIQGTLQGNAADGNAGNIYLEANGDINVSALQSYKVRRDNNEGTNGDITVISNNGSVNISQGIVTSYGNNALDGGNLSIQALTDVKINSIQLISSAINNSSSIEITSQSGNIDINNIETNSRNGNGGNIILNSDNTIDVGTITANTANGISGSISFKPINNALVANIILNGDITTTGNFINFSGAVTLNNDVTLTGGNINFASTLDGQKNLTINSSGNVDFKGLVGSLTPLQSLNITDSTGINIYNNITTNNGITFNAPATVHNPVELNTGTGTFTNTNTLNTGNNSLTITADDVNLTGTITGTNNLIIQPFSSNRNIDLGTNTANTLGLTAAEISNITNFNQLQIGRSDGTGNITVSSPVTFNVPTEILSGLGLINLNADVTSNNQNLTFGNIFLGNNVTISTGAGLGDLTFNGTINGTQNLTTNSGTGNTVFNGIVGGTNPLQNIAITTQNLDIKSQINTTNNGTFTLTNTGNFNLNAPLNLDGNFTQNGTGNNFLNFDILTTNDNISFASNVILNKTLNLTTGTGTLSFGGALNLGNNPQTFTTGELNFNGGNNSVTGTNTLTIQTATDNQNINLGSTTDTTALDLTNNDINALNTNFTNVTIGNDNGSGIMTVVSNINFTNPTILQMPKGNAVINGQITGSDDASLTLTALNTNLNNNLVTNNQNQTLNTNINLGNNVSLNTGTGLGNININGTIDNNYNLTLNAGTGNINLNGLLGGTTPLNNFTVTNASNLFLESGIIVNGTNLNFNSPVTLTNNNQLNTGNGDINFNNILNSATGETNNLLLTLGTGNLTINNAMGNNQRLGNININSVNNLNTNSPINANSLTSNNGTGTVNLTGNLNTTNGTTLTTNGNITTQNITTTGGNINITSNNGNVTVGNLSTSSALNGGNINLTSTIGIVNSGNLLTNSTNNGGNVNVIALQSMNLGIIDTSATLGNGGNVFLDPIGNIQFNYINAQGGTNGFGGDVDMTTLQGLVQGTGTFVAQNGQNATISTIGGLGGGSITIRHNGGDLFVPFIVNDALISGSAGVLTTGNFTISPVRVFPGSYYYGNISIITSDRFSFALADSLPDALPEEYKPKNVIEEGFFLDEYFTRLHERYLTQNANAHDVDIKSLDDIQRELKKVEGDTGVKPAIVYVFFEPKLIEKACDTDTIQVQSQGELCITNKGQLFRYENGNPDDDQLAIVVVTSDRKPQLIRMDFSEENYPTRKMMIRKITELRTALTQVSDPENPDEFNAYQEPSQQLYQYIMQPINNYLSALNQELLKENQRPVSNLVFIMDNNLRSMPLAVLQNEQKEFIIQQEVLPKTSEFYQSFQELPETNRFYSLGLMPSMSLTDTRYRDVRDGELLAMGTDKFTSQRLLPLIPSLLQEITKIWGSNDPLLDEDFNQEKLKSILSGQSYSIINLGTHGSFDTGNPDNSYIQFYGGDSAKLRLGNHNNSVRNLGLNGTELLVLNACQTALGDKDSELGFAGFAYQIGVKSVLASLWEVAQVGTSGLMLQFYDNLRDEKNNLIKAEALRQTQLTMINRQVYNTENQLIWSENNDNLPLPETLTETHYNHPYYWSSFTIIGNPW